MTEVSVECTGLSGCRWRRADRRPLSLFSGALGPAKEIEIKQDRFEHASEIIDEIAKKHIKFREVPVTIIYSEYAKAKGQSIFNSIKIALKLVISKLAR